MRSIFIVLSLFALYSTAASLRVHNFGKHAPGTALPNSVIPPFKTAYIEQFLDHFNLKDDRTFQQRFLYNGIK
jgi:hypothetical protein